MPLTCRHPFGLTFVLRASLGASCWVARSPSQGVRAPGLGALVAMLPLLRTTKSLFPLLMAMFQFLGPKRENDTKPTSDRQAGKDADKTGKLLEGVESMGEPSSLCKGPHSCSVQLQSHRPACASPPLLSVLLSPSSSLV